MVELICFALKRRFKNRATYLLNFLLFIGLGLAVFSDQLIDFFAPHLFDDQKVVLVDFNEELANAFLQSEIDGYTFSLFEEGDSIDTLLQKEDGIIILRASEEISAISLYPINQTVALSLQAVVNQTIQMMNLSTLFETSEQLQQFMEGYTLKFEPRIQEIDLSDEKSQLIFMLITSIYFTMLSSSTSVGNEVIYEKATKQLELILTSVQAKDHFFSKMVVGWLAILCQGGLLVFMVIFWLFVRQQMDQGMGLIALMKNLGFIQGEVVNFAQLFSFLRLETQTLSILCFVSLFLAIGIFFTQMVIVIFSSFIASMEEAGNIQAPIYLIFLAIYYFTLSVNTPYQLSQGIGFILSFFPFFSMLFMPCRLLSQQVAIFEILLSLAISLVAIYVILKKGCWLYQQGVLDYTSKGFIQIIKTAIKLGKEKDENC